MAHSSRTATHTPDTTPFALERTSDDWDIIIGDGPVVATSVHDGHAMRASMRPHLAVTDDERRREEDPLTGLFTRVGDVRVKVRASRFQVDLNRPRDKALSTDPDDTWGLKVWHGPLPDDELEESLAGHDRFYATIRALLDGLVERWGCVLLLDIHSYNHRRGGADAPPADQQGNPDIDLGMTTLDKGRWGEVAERFAAVLRETPAQGRHLDVRENVRYEDGGHFPEWVYATYGEKICTITPEYKKIYMDEWSAQADIGMIEDLRLGLQRAVDAVRGAFVACR